MPSSLTCAGHHDLHAEPTILIEKRSWDALALKTNISHWEMAEWRPEVLATGMIFLSQTLLGVLGNFSLLYHYIFLYFRGCKLKSTDLFLKHLIVANFLVILSKGIPQMITAFGLKSFLNDFGCKLVFYVHRMGRGVSISSTCLLSVFQAITISSRNSQWAKLKGKAPKYTGFSVFLCWVLYIRVNIIFPMYITSNKNITNRKDFGDCSSVFHDETTNSLHTALLLFPDAVCLGLMIWASGSMVFILHKHKQQVQHIHRNNISPKSSPESRATLTIFVLVSTFVSFYTLSSIFQSFLALFHNPGWVLVNISALISGCFPAVSPFLLMIRDSNVSMLCFAQIRETKFSTLVRKI
ncbi:vomeronasal type-1 receptor 4-like isoform X2 [Elephas maximus indicus]|uniref:vomeronasal type-1 receptor 4-like isoform X2 n=1 Tax=Elephas maximus indicus TaxID=99487 RepID=UPI0021163C3B|nr:vomeronasal type-1 receptor 4-like isoform X2 [Elephas maximus indicus]